MRIIEEFELLRFGLTRLHCMVSFSSSYLFSTIHTAPLLVFNGLCVRLQKKKSCPELYSVQVACVGICTRANAIKVN
jgi:hypothetical protein